MNRKAHIIEENLQRLINCVKDRPQSTDSIIENISNTTSLTRRQIFRYLNLAVDQGLLIRPLRGFYAIPDESIPNFEDFNCKNADMSLTIKHNSTETTTLTLSDTIDLIIKTACIECTKEDRRRIEYIMGQSDWSKVTPETVLDYCEETWKRFGDSVEKYEVKFSARYFFGILRRVLCTTIDDMKRFYKKFLEQQAERKRLMEQEAEASNKLKEQDDFILGENTPNTPEEWKDVEKSLSDNANKHGLSKPKPIIIKNVVSLLNQSMFNPVHVMDSLTHMVTHDLRGFCYMVRNLSSFETVVRCIEKNYDRYLSFLNKESIFKETITIDKKSTRDPRYSAFYDLFPSDY